MWVKICANTCVEDALAAAESGADAVGFVFASSRRQVTPEQVRAITAELPQEVERVGVFAGETEQRIAEAVRIAGLTAVQLHGGLDVEFAERLRLMLGPQVALIHVVHWQVEEEEAAAVQVAALLKTAESLPAEDRLLIDAKVGTSSGGLGVGYDWQTAARVLSTRSARRIIVAGGLNPLNVGEAVRTVRPYGVDVASGIEREPGRKDYAQVAKFIRNARSAE